MIKDQEVCLKCKASIPHRGYCWKCLDELDRPKEIPRYEKMLMSDNEILLETLRTRVAALEEEGSHALKCFAHFLEAIDLGAIKIQVNNPHWGLSHELLDYLQKSHNKLKVALTRKEV